MLIDCQAPKLFYISEIGCQMPSYLAYISHASCACGKVSIEITGNPIASVACYCTSCREAGRAFDRLQSLANLVDEDGGTEMILVRKDRVQCVRGGEFLEEHRLVERSPTRRVISVCCSSPMFLDFSKGHWLTMYRDRFEEKMLATQMRLMTGDRIPGKELSDDVPNHKGHSIRFMINLLLPWFAMGFRRPKISWGKPVAN